MRVAKQDLEALPVYQYRSVRNAGRILCSDRQHFQGLSTKLSLILRFFTRSIAEFVQ